MFIDIEKREQTHKKLEISLGELKYMLFQTYALTIPKDALVSFSIPGAENNLQPILTLSWSEDKEEKYSDLVLSNVAAEEVLKAYETVKDTFPTVQAFLTHVLESAMKEAQELKEIDLNLSGGNKV